MKWDKITFLKNKKTGKTDELNNPIYETVEICIVDGRIGSWSADDVQVESRDFTLQNSKLIAKPIIKDITEATHVIIKGQRLEIKRLLVSTMRWNIFAVEKYGYENKI